MISMSVPAWTFRLQTRPATSAANGPTRWLTELAKRALSCDVGWRLVGNMMGI